MKEASVMFLMWTLANWQILHDVNGKCILTYQIFVLKILIVKPYSIFRLVQFMRSLCFICPCQLAIMLTQLVARSRKWLEWILKILSHQGHGSSKGGTWWQLELLEVLEDISPLIWKACSVLTVWLEARWVLNLCGVIKSLTPWGWLRSQEDYCPTQSSCVARSHM